MIVVALGLVLSWMLAVRTMPALNERFGCVLHDAGRASRGELYFALAIAGLLLLAYGFLPVYRKLNVYTLSEYLSRRYDDRCRVLYAVLMIFALVVIQIVPGFYIGSRSLNILLAEDTAAAAEIPE